MHYFLGKRGIAIVSILISGLAHAADVQEVMFKLYPSVVKVQVSNQQGNRGIGSGVVVSEDHVVTNCHVVANAQGIAVTKYGESYLPEGMQADWHHDLCILHIPHLGLPPVQLGDAAALQYGQSVFSIGFPGNPMKPLTALGKIKGMYNLEGAQVIRTSAAFRMGASGGALFDNDGRLIGINTFKSPGRNGHYYSLPIDWVKKLLDAPEIAVTTQRELPFWDAPEDKRPYFMQVIDAQKTEQWTSMKSISTAWMQQDPLSPEPWYTLAIAEDKMGNTKEAVAAYRKTLALNPRHASALYDWGLLAQRVGDTAEVSRLTDAMAAIDGDVADEFKQAIAPTPSTP